LNGEWVRIETGPFSGLHGTLANVDGQRAVVAVKLQTGQIEVEMDLEWIVSSPAERRPASAEHRNVIHERRSTK